MSSHGHQGSPLMTWSANPMIPGEGATGPPTALAPPPPTTSHHTFWSRSDADCDSLGDSTESGEPSSSTLGTAGSISGSGGGAEQLWACPFSKWKPLSYQVCHEYKLKEISRVKQHLRRRHRIPLHCEVCGLEFGDEETKADHVDANACRPAVSDPSSSSSSEPFRVGIGTGTGTGLGMAHQRTWEGVTPEQQELLERRMERNKTKAEQWYTIYEILFPGQPQPPSPFRDTELLSPQMRSFQQFLASDSATEIIDNVSLACTPPQLSAHRDEIQSLSQAVFEHAMPALLQRYEASQRQRHHQSLRAATMTPAAADTSTSSSRLALRRAHTQPVPGEIVVDEEGPDESWITTATAAQFTRPILGMDHTSVSASAHHQYGGIGVTGLSMAGAETTVSSSPSTSEALLSPFHPSLESPWADHSASTSFHHHHHPQATMADSSFSGISWDLDFPDMAYYRTDQP